MKIEVKLDTTELEAALTGLTNAMSEISVFVQARPHPNGSGVYAERRCRCGMCFDAEGSAVSVTADQLERLKADPMLKNGATPLEVGPGDVVQIVRAVSTYTRNAEGTTDISLLDMTTIRTLDYTCKAVKERVDLRFPREKLSARTPAKVRSEVLDVLRGLDDLEILEEVEANAEGVIAERDLNDPNRLNIKIPADVVNGLHVLAARVDLLL